MGQAQYDNVGEAEALDFSDLTLTGFPSVEFRPLYKLVFQVGAYSNTAKARLRSVIDVRQISATGIGQAIGSDHGNLSGLGERRPPAIYPHYRESDWRYCQYRH